jgi:mono/diheme cytochrome c family protein
MFRTWINLSIALVFLLLAGCRQEMAQQPSYRPLRPSAFFENGMSARPLVNGTVARGQLKDDVHLHEGKWPQEIQARLQAAGTVGAAAAAPFAAMIVDFQTPLYADAFPFPITRTELDRGQERYNIYCAVCHDRAGTGRGMIVQRGFTPPPSYHTDFSRGLRLRGIRQKLHDAPVGYYFEIITHGFGAMPDYAEQLSAKDRWAIIAYIRALQLSQRATLADVYDDTAKQKLLRGLP